MVLDLSRLSIAEGTGVHNIVVLVLGPRGSGKTVLGAAVARALSPPGETVVVDPVGWMGRYLGRPGVTLTEADGAELFFGKLIREGRPKFVVIDEFNSVGTAQGYICKSLSHLVEWGRNWGFGILAVARATRELPVQLRNNADLVFVSAIKEPNQQEYFADWFGKDVSEKMRHLPEHVFVIWYRGQHDYVIVKDGALTWYEPGKELAGLENAAGTTAPTTPVSADTSVPGTVSEPPSAGSAGDVPAPATGPPTATDATPTPSVSPTGSVKPPAGPGSV